MVFLIPVFFFFFLGIRVFLNLLHLELSLISCKGPRKAEMWATENGRDEEDGYKERDAGTSGDHVT